MAMDHPELSQNLCIEMLTRVLDVADKVTRHQILICLPPWMQNLSFSGILSLSYAAAFFSAKHVRFPVPNHAKYSTEGTRSVQAVTAAPMPC